MPDVQSNQWVSLFRAFTDVAQRAIPRAGLFHAYSVIEDNRDILANVLDYLQLKGYSVDCAQDGL